MDDKLTGGWIAAILAGIGAILTFGRYKQRVDDINEIKTSVREISAQVQKISERLARLEGRIGE